ncbi:MAG: PspA-associated protein PspAB [Nocardioides sp.]
MGLWGAMTGRMRVKKANLDSLFLLPSAAITLQTAAGINPTGAGSVCFRAASGAAFAQARAGLVELINAAPDAPDVEVSEDRFGFTWLVVRRDPNDVGGLCVDLHAVNTILTEQDFGSGLLCSLVAFRDPADHPLGLVYLYKQGTFYPFAPVPRDLKHGDLKHGDRQHGDLEQRDNLLELQVRDHLSAELPMEADLQRWMSVWGAPGLD